MSTSDNDDEGKVLEFKRKADKVYECVCGSQSFFMFEGGEIQCRSCEETKRQRWYIPEKGEAAR